MRHKSFSPAPHTLLREIIYGLCHLFQINDPAHHTYPAPFQPESLHGC